jgi:hypothetical protein
MQRESVILHESVTQDRIDSNEQQHWLQVFDIQDADSEAGTPKQVIFWTLDGQTQIRHVTDLQSGYPFLVIEGESISETVKKIYLLFPTYSREDVFRIIRNRGLSSIGTKNGQPSQSKAIDDNYSKARELAWRESELTQRYLAANGIEDLSDINAAKNLMKSKPEEFYFD